MSEFRPVSREEASGEMTVGIEWMGDSVVIWPPPTELLPPEVKRKAASMLRMLADLLDEEAA